MSTTRPTKAERRHARLEAARATKAREERRRRRARIGAISGTALLVVALAVVGVLVFRGADNSATATGQGGASALPATPALVATGRTSGPPWTAPGDVSAAVHAAGLPLLGSEGTTEHIHAHLDVIVNGSPVPVPADIGVDGATQQVSPLHTHDTTGVIHVESPKVVDFSLGQFFTEWQVSLSSTNIGGLRTGGGDEVRAYLNGKPYTGDPAAIILHAHDEIALVYGPATGQADVPGSYNFGPDL